MGNFLRVVIKLAGDNLLQTELCIVPSRGHLHRFLSAGASFFFSVCDVSRFPHVSDATRAASIGQFFSVSFL